MKMFKLLPVFLGIIISMSTYAQDESMQAPQVQSEEESSTIESPTTDASIDFSDKVKEVFMKGSTDGESVFMVLGLDKGIEISKKILDKTIELEKISELKDRINNENHQNDYRSEIKDGKEFADEHVREILKAPLRTLRKIPGTYRLTLDLAKEAYENTPNHVAGGVKYGAIAVWAHFKGAYYLVIETPTRFFYNLFATTLAVPYKITMQSLEIGVRFSWYSLKALGGIIASGAVSTYAVISSSLNTFLYIVKEGGLLLLRGGEFLAVDLPRSLKFPITLNQVVEINPEKEQSVDSILSHFLSESLGENRSAVVKLEKTKNELRFFVDIATDNDEAKAYKIVLSKNDENKYEIKYQIYRSYFRKLKKSLKNQVSDQSDEVQENNSVNDDSDESMSLKEKIKVKMIDELKGMLEVLK